MGAGLRDCRLRGGAVGGGSRSKFGVMSEERARPLSPWATALNGSGRPAVVTLKGKREDEL